MIELFLILGLLFVLLITIVLHICATCNHPIMLELTNISGDPTLHPWFIIIEAILLLSILYISKYL